MHLSKAFELLQNFHVLGLKATWSLKSALFCLLIYVLFFETGSFYVAQASLELTMSMY
jgi:hypothetical protein